MLNWMLASAEQSRNPPLFCIQWRTGKHSLNSKYLAASLLIFFFTILSFPSIWAQTPDPTPLHVLPPPERPPLGPFPRYEDWSFLRNPSNRVDRYDRLKFLPLDALGTAYLTLGVEDRTEFQYLSSSDWGAGPQDHSGYLVQRFMADADLRLGNHARIFLTLKFDDVGDKHAGPRPGIDKDIADFHEAFVELGGDLHALHPGTDFILGRQEIVFGAGRLFDDNEGVNVRNSFDGARIGYDRPSGRVDLFAVKPVLNKFGAWDDVPNHAVSVWGMYASNLRLLHPAMFDTYFIGFDDKSMTYGTQQAREIRQTGGLRLFNRLAGEPPRAGFDYNNEGVIQWGAFGDRSIHAWGAGSEIGWTAPQDPWRIRIGFRADAISGDRGNPHTLGTFNALFPRGAYFGPKFALVGPANLLDVQPMLEFHPWRNVTGTAEWIWFWRESTKDALYSFQNVPLRPGNLSQARYIGNQPNLELRWAMDEHFTMALNIASSFPGAFLRQSPPAQKIAFVNAGLTYRF
jgi:hypothetical protein